MRAIYVRNTSLAAVWAWRFTWLSILLLLVIWFLYRQAGLVSTYIYPVLLLLVIINLLALALAIRGALAVWRYGDKGGAKSILSGVFNLGVLLFAGVLIYRSFSLPVLTDLSTDIVNPPAFIESIQTKKLSLLQRTMPKAAQKPAHYVVLDPIYYDRPVDVVAKYIVNLLLQKNWPVVAQVFPVKDGAFILIQTELHSWALGKLSDIAIRIREQDGITRLDVRSSFAKGFPDFGLNKAFLKSFLQELDEQVIFKPMKIIGA